MTLADDLKPMLSSIRAIPGQLGIRPYRVYVVTGSWTGTYPGDGTETATETEITETGGQPPKVRMLDDEQRALGDLASGAVEIGPITPNFTGGGTAFATIQPTLSNGQTLRVKLVGPEGTNYYRIHKVGADRAMHWKLTCEPLASS